MKEKKLWLQDDAQNQPSNYGKEIGSHIEDGSGKEKSRTLLLHQDVLQLGDRSFEGGRFP